MFSLLFLCCYIRLKIIKATRTNRFVKIEILATKLTYIFLIVLETINTKIKLRVFLVCAVTA